MMMSDNNDTNSSNNKLNEKEEESLLSFEPVFILAGQSNMVGRCCITDNEVIKQSNTYNGIEFYMCYENDFHYGDPGCSSSNGTFLPLQTQYSPLFKQEMYGPEFGIASTLGTKFKGVIQQRPVYFIKFAMGSTNLYNNWNPNNTNKDGKRTEIGYYNTFINFVKKSLTSLNNESSHDVIPKKLVGMFWLQGESDSSAAKTANAYLSNFQTFISSIRSDLNCPELTIVTSPIVWHGKKVHVINQALKGAANIDENCICIDPLHPSFGVLPKETGIRAGHLTGTGATDIGRRMGEAFPIQKHFLTFEK